MNLKIKKKKIKKKIVRENSHIKGENHEMTEN